MNRKSFLTSVLPIAGTFPGFSTQASGTMAAAVPIIPAYLEKGDKIGITCPAGYITEEELQPALKKLSEWGFNIAIGKTVGKKDFGFGGTDEERREDMQQMLDNKTIKAIICARGGYGSVRIIDQLDFSLMTTHPKWIVGFSDVTVLHSQWNRLGIASIHSKMCNSFPEDWAAAEPIQKETIESIYKCLSGDKVHYSALGNPKNRRGKGMGSLVGGNLKTIESLAGSRSDLVTDNKLLFVEDTMEYLYNIDRMFWNLKRSGKLDRLQGLIIGGFKIKKDDEGEEFGKLLEEIVLEKVAAYQYPVCFDFPVGHQKNNFALKCGVTHKLEVNDSASLLLEL